MLRLEFMVSKNHYENTLLLSGSVSSDVLRDMLQLDFLDSKNHFENTSKGTLVPEGAPMGA